jgi:acetyl-CoA decarbonylase/synthase complex subunit delta
MVHGHNIIAQSPVDVNIAKQLNILLTDMNVKENRIVIDPLVSSLGYGMEYSYSVMERVRLSALRDDKMLSMPMINLIGEEAWDVKETKTSEEEEPSWGELTRRGVLWETSMATTMLQGGADILVVRHPETVENSKKVIDDLMKA